MIKDRQVSAATVASLYDAIAPSYDQSYVDKVSLYEYRVLTEVVSRVLKGGSVLDLGSGTGLFLDLGFRPEPTRYHGVDISTGMVEIARRKYPSYRFSVEDFRTCRLEPAENVVALNGPFSYVLNGDLGFFVAAIKPGGRFVITLLGKGDGVTLRRDRGSTKFSPFEVRRYTIATAKRTLSPLVIDGIRGLNACLPLGNQNSRFRWFLNRILERLAPSSTEHVVLWGHRERE